ncbi:YIP1 family protein [Yoonia sp. 2307UL14-13]|uniref:YIP1 family protein n=1 Tax=Yoonia sp. 2307UL14-13 TaxID=3126506 RepID=UPI0030A54B69
MQITFQGWMRAVWLSLIEPADIARETLKQSYPTQALWLAIALIAVLHVLMFAAVQALVPAPEGAAAVSMSPFGLAGLIGMSLALMIYALFYSGRALDGDGDLHGTLTLMVWFHAVSLTVEAIQIPLVLISPYMAALYSMIALGGLLWCILNFINVLHGFKSIAKSLVVLVMALVGMGLIGGLVLAVLGVNPGGAT